jgi:kinesin family protein 1
MTPSADGDPNVNPWADPNDPTMTGTSIRTPQYGENDRDAEIVNYGKTLLPAFVDGKAEDAALEKQHLTRQLRNMAQEMKRVRAQAAKDRALDRPIEEQADWSARELKLVRWAVGQWKRLRVFKVAEQLLTQAVLLREANVMV